MLYLLLYLPQVVVGYPALTAVSDCMQRHTPSYLRSIQLRPVAAAVPPNSALSNLQAGGFIGGLAALGAGLWAANEYGYINLSQATQGLQASIPQLGVSCKQQ